MARQAIGSEPGHRARLLSNNNYDLAAELTEILTGLWRIDQYIRDAADGNCQECGILWQDIRKQKEILAEKLREEIARHVKSGVFV